jgi:hypothetical protein
MKYVIAILALLATILVVCAIVEDHALQIAERDFQAALTGETLSRSVLTQCGQARLACELPVLAALRGGMISAKCVDTIPPFGYAGFQCRAQFRDGTEVWSDVWVRPRRTEIFFFAEPDKPAA